MNIIFTSIIIPNSEITVPSSDINFNYADVIRNNLKSYGISDFIYAVKVTHSNSSDVKVNEKFYIRLNQSCDYETVVSLIMDDSQGYYADEKFNKLSPTFPKNEWVAPSKLLKFVHISD